eukprot:11629256-Ditylum_brightwellii.AAC.1
MELHQHLSNNQYGGREGRSAIDIPVRTVFSLDMIHMMRANITFVYCGARACYDKIVVIMSALSEQVA